MKHFKRIFNLKLLFFAVVSLNSFETQKLSAQTTFYELELVVAYEANMTTAQISDYNLPAKIQRTNEIFCATPMLNNIRVKVIEVIPNANHLPSTTTTSLDAMIYINANGNTFTQTGDKALYVTNTPFLPQGGPTTEHLYGATWPGTINFPQNCNNKTILMVNQNDVETQARLLVRYIGRGFAALSILNQTQGLFHFHPGQMTATIDAANAAIISTEIPKSYANDPVNYPQCMDIISVSQSTYYADADGDGQGDLNNSTLACSPPSGYVANSDDCDDANALIYDGAPEVCGNGIDDDCDGQIDEGCSTNPCDSYNNPEVYTDNTQLPGTSIYIDKNLILNGFSLNQNTDFHAGTSILLEPGYDSGTLGTVSEYVIEPCNWINKNFY